MLNVVSFLSDVDIPVDIQENLYSEQKSNLPSNKYVLNFKTIALICHINIKL